MLYFKNIDLAKKYQVSLGTVRNWIESAEEQKLDLSLEVVKGRQHISNTAANIDKIEELVDERRKYRNNRAMKKVSPQKKFYKLFSEEQIYDIAVNLEIHHEIPLQYNYFDGGADKWDEYIIRLSKEENENSYNATQKLIASTESTLDSLLDSYNRVNIVDIGAGNAMPARKILEYLLSRNKLGRYMAIDISPRMLEIARRNVKSWFGDNVDFEAYERNINQDRFADLLIPEYARPDYEKTINIVLHLGSTLYNMQRPENGYRAIYDSIGKSDLLLEVVKPDSQVSRTYFDYGANLSDNKLSPLNALVFDLLNIDDSLFDVEFGYDEKTRQRFERIRLKVALEIVIDFKDGSRTISMNKDDTILMWRVLHNESSEFQAQKDRIGFNVLHSSQSENQHFMLTISRVKQTA